VALSYFFQGGILSCGLTHLAVTPLDLVKCNAQVCWDHFPPILLLFLGQSQGISWRICGIHQLFTKYDSFQNRDSKPFTLVQEKNWDLEVVSPVFSKAGSPPWLGIPCKGCANLDSTSSLNTNFPNLLARKQLSDIVTLFTSLHLHLQK
jgi:hypothetical protein